MMERRLAKLRAEREGLGTDLPKEELERIIPLLIQGLDFFEGKKILNDEDLSRLIKSLEPYRSDEFVNRNYIELKSYLDERLSFRRRKPRINY